jgi:hydrogenase maturation protein HypF
MPRDDPGTVALLRLPQALNRPLMAMGGQMKACLALGFGTQVIISADLGDLDTALGIERFETMIDAMQHQYGVTAESLICDAHPGYTSTRWASSQKILPVRHVFHHHAHAGGIAGEFAGEPRWLCFAWDGAGMGVDGTFWGGEALLGMPGRWIRAGSFRPFAPLGGELAARQPWRSAAALAWAAGMEFSPPIDNIDRAKLDLAKKAWSKRVNSPQTSAVGRLFDAAASFLDLVHIADFEAEGPIAVEAAALAAAEYTGLPDAVSLPMHHRDDGVLEADWMPLVPLLYDAGTPAGERAAAFHASLALTLVVQAITLRDAHGDFAVGLSGGVFQNRLLTKLTLAALSQAGFRAYLPTQTPCHDGGLSFGQVVEAAAMS